MTLLHPFYSEEAVKYGLDESIVLCFVRNYKLNAPYTIKEFKMQFPFWSDRQIRKIVKSLLDQGLIREVECQRHSMDRTKLYEVVE